METELWEECSRYYGDEKKKKEKKSIRIRLVFQHNISYVPTNQTQLLLLFMH